jgi:hypothetical protein
MEVARIILENIEYLAENVTQSTSVLLCFLICFVKCDLGSMAGGVKAESLARKGFKNMN